MRKTILLIILFFAFFNVANGHEKKDSIGVEKRIEQLEAQDFKESEEHKLRLEELDIALEKKKQNLIMWVIGFLGFGTLAGIIASFFLIPNYIRTQVQKGVDEEIRDVIHGRSNDVRRMLAEYGEENLLLKQKKIFVYGEDLGHLESILTVYGFDSTNFITDKTKLETCDAILINNLSSQILSDSPKKDDEDSDIKKQSYDDQFNSILSFLKEQKKDKCFLYYSEKGINFPIWNVTDVQLKSRINFCTNPAQICSNLINTLKYQNRI